MSLPPLQELASWSWESACKVGIIWVAEQEDGLGNMLALIEGRSNSEEEEEDKWWPGSGVMEEDGEERVLQVEGVMPLSAQHQQEPKWDEHYKSKGLGEASPLCQGSLEMGGSGGAVCGCFFL